MTKERIENNMRYYIFGSDKSETIKTRVGKAVFASESINEAADKFKKYTNEIRYRNMYLVADYGCIGSSVFTYATIEPKSFNDNIPFFIIMEYHFGQDRSLIVRKDHTTITHKRGYSQVFDDNLRAARVFEDCVYNMQTCQFTISYMRNCAIDKTNITQCVYHKTIADSDDIRRRMNMGLEKYISRFIIKTPEWDFYPIEPRKRIFNFKLEKPTEMNVNESSTLMVSAPGK